MAVAVRRKFWYMTGAGEKMKSAKVTIILKRAFSFLARKAKQAMYGIVDAA